ncbi:MAG: Ribosome biogenesis protein brx1, partial [Paramarteilia canceri]
MSDEELKVQNGKEDAGSTDKKKYTNKQRMFVVMSRGSTLTAKKVLKDFIAFLPHSKK